MSDYLADNNDDDENDDDNGDRWNLIYLDIQIQLLQLNPYSCNSHNSKDNSDLSSSDNSDGRGVLLGGFYTCKASRDNIWNNKMRLDQLESRN